MILSELIGELTFINIAWTIMIVCQIAIALYMLITLVRRNKK